MIVIKLFGDCSNASFKNSWFTWNFYWKECSNCYELVASSKVVADIPELWFSLLCTHFLVAHFCLPKSYLASQNKSSGSLGPSFRIAFYQMDESTETFLRPQFTEIEIINCSLVRLTGLKRPCLKIVSLNWFNCDLKWGSCAGDMT